LHESASKLMQIMKEIVGLERSVRYNLAKITLDHAENYSWKKHTDQFLRAIEDV